MHVERVHGIFYRAFDLGRYHEVRRLPRHDGCALARTAVALRRREGGERRREM